MSELHNIFAKPNGLRLHILIRDHLRGEKHLIFINIYRECLRAFTYRLSSSTSSNSFVEIVGIDLLGHAHVCVPSLCLCLCPGLCPCPCLFHVLFLCPFPGLGFVPRYCHSLRLEEICDSGGSDVCKQVSCFCFCVCFYCSCFRSSIPHPGLVGMGHFFAVLIYCVCLCFGLWRMGGLRFLFSANASLYCSTRPVDFPGFLCPRHMVSLNNTEGLELNLHVFSMSAGLPHI